MQRTWPELAKAVITGIRDASVASSLPHDRYVTFQMAESAVSRDLFREIPRLIDELLR